VAGPRGGETHRSAGQSAGANPGTSLYLTGDGIVGPDINDRGEITGVACGESKTQGTTRISSGGLANSLRNETSDCA
jgi:hypothetical protein